MDGIDGSTHYSKPTKEAYKKPDTLDTMEMEQELITNAL